MMLIDFHTHTFPDELARKVIPKIAGDASIRYYTGATNSSLIESMNRAHVDLSVILPVVTKPSQCETINKAAIDINDRYFPQLMSFGGIHPDNENYREILKEMVKSGIKGIKLHPLYQGVAIDDIRNLKIIDCAGELGLTVVIHAGKDLSFPGDLADPDRISRMLDKVNPEKIVLAHMGSYALWEDVYEMLCGRGAYLDTSFSLNPIRPLYDTQEGRDSLAANPMLVPPLDRELFRKIVEKNGVEHMLFASDSPWCDQKETFDLVDECLNESEKDAVYYGNALHLLELPDI
ncbi:MAG: amidohydrolase family protein [Lachnospiraceae bacterium]|nr:amidohydrolase family protein [Lachnospiraceae bacterium]